MTSVKLNVLLVIIHCEIFHNFGNEFDFPYVDLTADDSKNLETIPKVEVVEGNVTTNLTENKSVELKNQTPIYDWTRKAIQEIAYYLRSQKFNGYDRRYYLNSTIAPRNFFVQFPYPPLRALHWEVHKRCEPDFLDCLKFLWSKVKKTLLRRDDDTAIVMQDQNWTTENFENQIRTVDESCQKALRFDNILAIPFEGPIERFQWCTTASYYLCWYTMHEMPHLKNFHEKCDNFASCLDNSTGPNNVDPRADDRIDYNCALYSLCPDPCCPMKYITDYEECWNSDLNPCKEENPIGRRQCKVERNKNVEFRNIILNRWNVTCNCTRKGFEWNSEYGLCVDIDECANEVNLCDPVSESCVNMPGSYECACSWGYEWNDNSKQCEESGILELLRKEIDVVQEVGIVKKPKSLLEYLKSLFGF